jgi:hypothetical protein
MINRFQFLLSIFFCSFWNMTQSNFLTCCSFLPFEECPFLDGYYAEKFFAVFSVRFVGRGSNSKIVNKKCEFIICIPFIYIF